ncbi:hypothetical protein AQI88_18985 [Streptomyces cellostaticus]|uniref:Putative zinc-finger domain-containing protein n=1 Tax=Streptomyces cellostaticus TaxID=67285 RepID=A0A101NKI9_9ACTN|nr:zf-HC2 domain-containing protein [Streptomyces cellostaticus]KUM94929.1 hypothetical protein AQI88_18985 [Streptomyces cellostaticus]GHI06432.1 hypothetical protein Scel_47530 [Streptomyces cellostaticus]
MTSTTDTAGHPDVAEISDLTEGLLPPDRTAEVRRHLAGCELCTDVHASLEEIRGLLGTVPGPPRMPADVAGRIDAAIAAEALLSATEPKATDTSVLVSGPEEPDSQVAGGRVSRETSPSADRPVGRPHGATGPGRKGRDRGRRRRTVVLGAVLTAAVLGAGSLVLQSLGSGGPDTTAQGRPTPSVGAFSGDSVQNQVKDLLSTKKGTEQPHRPRSGVDSEQNTPGSTASANTLIQTQPSVPDCVRKAIARSGDVLGAKTGTYAGKSAYLVVLPDSDDSTRVTAYVVDAACVGRQPASPGKVLIKESLARP